MTARIAAILLSTSCSEYPWDANSAAIVWTLKTDELEEELEEFEEEPCLEGLLEPCWEVPPHVLGLWIVHIGMPLCPGLVHQ